MTLNVTMLDVLYDTIKHLRYFHMLEGRGGLPAVVGSKAMNACLSQFFHSDNSFVTEATHAAKELIQ